MTAMVRRALAAAASALILLVGLADSASAQAFVPAKGDGTVTVVYQTALAEQHLGLYGPYDRGKIESRNMIVDFSMGLGHKVAFSVSVPLGAARYMGVNPHQLNAAEQVLYPNFVSLDDGAFHQEWQDLRAEIRYNLTTFHGFVVTPFVMGSAPTHHYTSFSHAAIGRDVRELQVGSYAARVFDRWLGGSFMQARYSHAFEETIANVPRSRDNLVLEGGYFATSRIRVFGMVAGQMTHGGIDVRTATRADFPGPLFYNHDRIQRVDFVEWGAGAGFALSPRIGLTVSVSRTLWGINGHAVWGSGIVAMSYSFGPSFRAVRTGGDTTAPPCHNDPRQHQLARCLCLKK